ncbi:hypothetical protein PR048_008141 [Dryococelus australis]|uniref:Uncharacterized protein n=1 Tax=Dryococelus australis TaxID=614101 RepID=A0ABQ9HW93_9NEOP|nr:hypothetical protein PR048_008141 [Dryococelus australis]
MYTTECEVESNSELLKERLVNAQMIQVLHHLKLTGLQVLNATALSTAISFDLKKKDYIACTSRKRKVMSIFFIQQEHKHHSKDQSKILYGCRMIMFYVLLHLLNLTPTGRTWEIGPRLSNELTELSQCKIAKKRQGRE